MIFASMVFDGCTAMVGHDQMTGNVACYLMPIGVEPGIKE
jgi:hypothetical protein